MRTTVFFDNVKNKVMVVHERLSKRPSGDAKTQRKALRSGWRPDWIQSERPYPLENVVELNIAPHIMVLPMGEVPEPLEVQGALTLSAFLTAGLPKDWEFSPLIESWRVWQAKQ